MKGRSKIENCELPYFAFGVMNEPASRWTVRVRRRGVCGPWRVRHVLSPSACSEETLPLVLLPKGCGLLNFFIRIRRYLQRVGEDLRNMEEPPVSRMSDKISFEKIVRWKAHISSLWRRDRADMLAVGQKLRHWRPTATFTEGSICGLLGIWTSHSK